MTKITKSWCKKKRNKTDKERSACHKLLKGSSKLPKRKYKRRKK